MEGILLRANTEYKSPLDLWHAWQVASKDPDLCLQQFIREGVPLGMSSKIPPSGGVFPPARNQEIQCVEAQVEFEECQNMVNYSSVQEHPREAEEEISRYKAKGFVRRMPWAEARDAYSIGTVSKLALILKPKADGSVKKRIVIDMLRSGGNSRADAPERIVLPRGLCATWTKRSLQCVKILNARQSSGPHRRPLSFHSDEGRTASPPTSGMDRLWCG